MKSSYSDDGANFDEEQQSHLTDSELDFESRPDRSVVMASNEERRVSSSSSVHSYPMVRSQTDSVSASSDRNWGSGIFIVSKSGPSWISDRSPKIAPPNVLQSPVHSYPGLSKNNEARSHRSFQASSQRESREFLHEPQQSFDDDRSDTTSIGKITNWLEAQGRAQQGLPDDEDALEARARSHHRCSSAPGRPELPLRVNTCRVEEHASSRLSPSHQQSPLSGFSAGPNGRLHRRVSGPRPQRPLSQAARIHGHSEESEESCSEKAYSEPGTILPARLQADVGSKQRAYLNCRQDTVTEESSESKRHHRLLKDDEDAHSMLGQMGSMSSLEGLSEGGEEQDANTGHWKASRISDCNEEDEERFWQGSNRNSVCTPLPGAAHLERSRSSTAMYSERDCDQGPDLRAETVLWSMDRRHSSQPAKELVLPQVANVANRLHGNAWRRSYQPAPLNQRNPPSDDGRAGPHPRSRQSSAHSPRFEQIRSSRNFSAGADGSSRDLASSRLSGECEHKSTESDYQGSTCSDSDDICQQTPTVQHAKRAAITRTDALLLISTSPSSTRRWPTTPLSPAAKTYAEVGTQTHLPHSDFDNARRCDDYEDTRWKDEENAMATSVTRRTKRPDLRIDTRPSAAKAGRSVHSSSRSSTVCCPQCGHHFQAASTVAGHGRSVAQARVQARAEAIASISRQSSSSSLKTTNHADGLRAAAPPLPPLAAAIAAARGASEHHEHSQQDGESDEEQLSEMRHGSSAPMDVEQSMLPRRSLSRLGSMKPRHHHVASTAFPAKPRANRPHEKRPSLQDVLTSFQEENGKSSAECSADRGSDESHATEAAQASPRSSQANLSPGIGMDHPRSLRLHTAQPLQDSDLSPRPASARVTYPASPSHSRPSTGNSLASSFNIAPSISSAGMAPYGYGYPSGGVGGASRGTAITPPSTSAGGSSLRHSGRIRSHASQGSLSEIAPFAVPSTKAMKLLGISDEDAQKPLPQYTDASTPYQNRDSRWRGSSSSLSSFISMSSAGLHSHSGPLRRFSISRGQPASAVPHAGGDAPAHDSKLGASLRAWRASRSHADVTAAVYPSASSREPTATHANSGPAQTDATPPAPRSLRKLKHALRKGKAKDTGDSPDKGQADYEDPGISGVLSVSHTAGASLGLGLFGFGNQAQPNAKSGDKTAAASRSSPGAVGEKPKWAPSPDVETFPALPVPEGAKGRHGKSRTVSKSTGLTDVSVPAAAPARRKAGEDAGPGSAPLASATASRSRSKSTQRDKSKARRRGSPPTAPPTIPLPVPTLTAAPAPAPSPPTRWALPSLDLADSARIDLRPRRLPSGSAEGAARATPESEEYSWFADVGERGQV